MIDHAQWLDSFVRASWQGALLVLAAWIALRLLKTAPARFRSWIWPIVMTKFLLVAFVMWELPVLAAPRSSGPAIAPTVTSGEFIEVSFVEPVAAPAVNIAQVLFVLWAIGVAVVLARATYEYLVLRKIASRATTAGHGIIRLCEGVADRHVTVKVHPDVPMPLVFGVIKPVVLLPSGIQNELSDEQLRMVLAHEVAHIQRRDTATAVYVFLCQALFFFNPAVWFAKREWQIARESACDQYAMERTGADCRQYADMLIEISAGARRAPAFALSAVPAYKTLHRRIDDMNRTPNKTMAARLAWSVVAAMIAAAALPVAFVPKQDSIGDAILAQLAKNKSKPPQATGPAPTLENQRILTLPRSELLRVARGQAPVAAPLRVQAMDVALARAVAMQSSIIQLTDVAQVRDVLVGSLQDPLPSARLIHSRGLLRLADPELTVQEAGVLKLKADTALVWLKQDQLRKVSFSTQKADQNEKYIALLEKYIALLEKHLKSIGGAPSAKVAYAIPSSGRKLPGFVTSTTPYASSAVKAATAAYARGVVLGKLPPDLVSGAALSASPAVKAATAAYARGIVLGRTVDVKAKFQSMPTNIKIEVDTAIKIPIGFAGAPSQSKVEVKVVEVEGKTFWIAAGPKAKIKVSTKEGTIQIVEADGKKFWVALKTGTVKADGVKLEVKVVEIDGKKVWIVTTPRKKEKADKKGG